MLYIISYVFGFRTRRLGEVQKHEQLPKHRHCVEFIHAWEEYQHLYIQTELCASSLSNYAENHHDIPERLIWNYLVDLLLVNSNSTIHYPAIFINRL